MRRSKKGALELSINAIVVLILAITILGLGIAFIRGQFTGLQKSFGEVRGGVETELKNKIKQSGELLYFDQSQIEVPAGTPVSANYGVTQNSEENKCYVVYVQCLGRTEAGDCGLQSSQPIPVDTVVGGTGTEQSNVKWIKLQSPIWLEQGTTEVYSMAIQISGLPADTYQLRLGVLHPTTGPDVSGIDSRQKCLDAGAEAIEGGTGTVNRPSWDSYTPGKTFFINYR